MAVHSIPAQFSAIGDLLWVAQRDKLSSTDELVIRDDGLLGPLVEVGIFRAESLGAFSRLTIDGPIGCLVLNALEHGRISGNHAGDAVGIFPLAKMRDVVFSDDRYAQWRLRFQTAAIEVGCPRPFAMALSGVLGELVDNVHEHAGDLTHALAGFRVERGRVEIVVADAGIGVLSSLRQNPKHAGLRDAAAALRAIVHEGATRHPDETHHGQGVRQLFRTLVGHYGHLRFRTGDHALALRGEGPLDRGMLESRTEAPLPGFMINVLCVFSAPSAT